MQEAFRNQREMEWNSALAGRDEARPLPVHHSREQRTGRCGHRPLRRRSRLAARRMAGAREETGERHAGSSCPTGESPGRDAPSWFPALAPERIEIIFRRGVYVAKNTSQAASVENGRPNGAAILCAQSACAFIRLDGFAVKVRKSLAEMFLGTFQRFKISMNSSPVMVSFS